MAIVTDKQAAVIGLVGVVVLYIGYQKAKQVAEDIGNAIDPTSQDNIFYGGANAITREVTGDPNATLGSKIYDGVDYVSRLWK